MVSAASSLATGLSYLPNRNLPLESYLRRRRFVLQIRNCPGGPASSSSATKALNATMCHWSPRWVTPSRDTSSTVGAPVRSDACLFVSLRKLRMAHHLLQPRSYSRRSLIFFSWAHESSGLSSYLDAVQIALKRRLFTGLLVN